MEAKIHDQEIHLQKLWKSRKLFGQRLVALSGEEIEVIYAGGENLDTGPDFKEALIKLNGKLLRGDIEVHLDSAGWYAHGHHQDPRYNDVILHIVSQADQDRLFIEREDGVPVPQLLIDPEEVKTKLWKNRFSVSQGDSLIVADCPLSRCDEAKITKTVSQLGERRLLAKGEQLREERESSSWEQLIYKKMLEALGYSKNQQPFARLAELIPYKLVTEELRWVSVEMAEKKAAALLFGAAGLLPSQSGNSEEQIDEEGLAYIGSLEYLWNQMSHRLQISPMKWQAWQFFRLRPQNFPTRRLAGMAQLVCRLHPRGLLDGFLKAMSSHGHDYERISKAIEALLFVPAKGFWLNRYRLTDSVARKDGRREAALIGKSRAAEIVINILLPVLFQYGEETKDGFLANTVREMYARYPKLASNSITKAMQAQLFQNRKSSYSGVKSASDQQGLIMLHKLYCKPLKCQECLTLST